MREPDLQARLKELYLPRPNEFVQVDVPDMRFIMIDGHGAADRSPLEHAAKWLFAAIHPLKRVARERMGKSFVQPPLECLWWADDPTDFVSGNREKMNWRMMIVYEPDWLTVPMFEDAVSAAQARLGESPAGLRLEVYREGLSVQTMHVGPPEAEVPTINRLHREYLPAHDLVPDGHHHEIYLTDPSRVAPENQRTVLRQPVKRCTTAG
ncbi:MAG: GyrI-like domain-containing protein [Phycisphaeraceae bacterium]|nr:GyrI-like domain-containing protein [Phycisphaeraceae bacterium]